MEREFYPMYYEGVRAPFARSNVVGPFVFCSGAGGMKKFDSDKRVFEAVGKDVESQAELACQKIKKALEEAGTSMENIFKVTNYVTSYEVWEKALPVVSKYMPVENISATLVVVGLAHPSMHLEIEAMAFKP